mmetsp:Transcript_27242/g.71755  ORF Transcript_27242/g.71755 Transcript_27242/m.71755 type:complete len:256 (+) Transcript_27242:372-1139(+)
MPTKVSISDGLGDHGGALVAHPALALRTRHLVTPIGFDKTAGNALRPAKRALANARCRHALLHRVSVLCLTLAFKIAFLREVVLLLTQATAFLAALRRLTHEDRIFLGAQIHLHNKVAEGTLFELLEASVQHRSLNAGLLEPLVEARQHRGGKDTSNLGTRQLRLAALGAGALEFGYAAAAQLRLHVLLHAGRTEEMAESALDGLLRKMLAEAALTLQQEPTRLTVVLVTLLQLAPQGIFLPPVQPLAHAQELLA